MKKISNKSRRSRRSRRSRTSHTLITDKNNLKNTSGYIYLDYKKYKKFSKKSKLAPDKYLAKNIVERILNKYKKSMNKLDYQDINDILLKEYIYAGYEGNLSADVIWVRDAITPFLLKKDLNNTHYDNYKVIYKITKNL